MELPEQPAYTIVVSISLANRAKEAFLAELDNKLRLDYPTIDTREMSVTYPDTEESEGDLITVQVEHKQRLDLDNSDLRQALHRSIARNVYRVAYYLWYFGEWHKYE